MRLDESTILLDIEATDQESVLKQMADNLVREGLVKTSFVQAIIAREKEYPTGLPTAGVAVAIPHTDVEHVNEKSISIGRLKEPIPFGMMGGDPSEQVEVKIVFMLAMKEAHAQLSLLQQLMQLFQNERKLMQLVHAASKEEVKKLIDDSLELTAQGGN
ncbi:PTS sugar transporter subunit IIA [Shouchella lehensis]|uniref:Phosphoenolpyruvate-dependent sugar phosphotransferase system enzyme IIA component n=2 Tax=Shouchella lehensis TaxID=300825 RepID=A0A060M090_9BACI|nr:PTS sugar transporter subunit IIA [Shouchella lehensis]AIC93474.1 phosphoenolpyruvate-dependent sugar phosphotransferase system enzyme IIA component [Shouchella lehensis G1]MBG9782816.1 PTS sugar transporter subunit IIA [Shouchella lehensis]TES49843.1 PTS sugar transporter subunit IIA [Shouchella lehensis]